MRQQGAGAVKFLAGNKNMITGVIVLSPRIHPKAMPVVLDRAGGAGGLDDVILGPGEGTAAAFVG
jgi:hypothetical protein